MMERSEQTAADSPGADEALQVDGGQDTGRSLEQPQDTAAEDRARRHGWRPKEEFRGDPEKWVPADAFLGRVESELPIMRERLRAMEARDAERERTIKELAEHHQKVREREYERAMQDIEARRQQAIETLDIAAYDKTLRDERALEERRPKPEPERTVAPDGGSVTAPPEVLSWVKDNPWFDRDQELRDFAASMDTALSKSNPNQSISDRLKAVSERTRRAFPERFENPRRAAPPAVDGGGAPRRAAGGKTYSDLPADAKAACDRFVKQGVMSREKYVQEFFGE